jgi:hypothetical protein
VFLLQACLIFKWVSNVNMYVFLNTSRLPDLSFTALSLINTGFVEGATSTTLPGFQVGPVGVPFPPCCIQVLYKSCFVDTMEAVKWTELAVYRDQY